MVIFTLVPKEYSNSPVAPTLAYYIMTKEDRCMPGLVAQLQLFWGKLPLAFAPVVCTFFGYQVKNDKI